MSICVGYTAAKKVVAERNNVRPLPLCDINNMVNLEYHSYAELHVPARCNIVCRILRTSELIYGSISAIDALQRGDCNG